MYVLTHIQSVKCKYNNGLASSQSLEHRSLQEKWSLWWERVQVAMWVLAVQARTWQCSWIRSAVYLVYQLFTFAPQVASRALGVPTSKIYISETSTNTVPNTSPTAASVSADINGMAVLVWNLSYLKEGVTREGSGHEKLSFLSIA